MRTFIASITCGPICSVMALRQFVDVGVGGDLGAQRFLQIVLGRAADDAGP